MSNVRSGRYTKRTEMREKRRKQEQRRRVLIFSIIGIVVLVIVAVAVVPSLIPANIKTVTLNPRPQANQNSMGDPNAPVKVVEYSDYQCPFCRQFAEEVEPQIETQYVETGKVYFTYRSMGNWIGPESVAAAEAAYCAGDQGKFWEYHDLLFANWKGENIGSFNTKNLQAFAKSLNLDTGSFNSCMNSNKYADKINQDRADGEKTGMQGTPSFIINGELYKGNFSGLGQAIEAKLNAAK